MAEISLPWEREKGLLSQNPKTLNPKPIGKWATLGMKAQLEVGSVDVGLELRELSQSKSLSKAKDLVKFEWLWFCLSIKEISIKY